MVTRRSFVSALSELAAGTTVAPAVPPGPAPTLFELRNYATRPGGRDRLIDVFENHLLDAYERAGARVLGTFTHAYDADRWIWIRAFADNRARGSALDGFYTSAEWFARRDAANDAIADISDALLLRLVSGDLAALRPPGRDARRPGTVFECLRWFPRAGGEAALADRVLDSALPLLAKLGAEPVAVLQSVALPNAYPRLPLREDPALVVLTRFADAAAHAAHLAARDRSVAWWRAVEQITSPTPRPLDAWPLQPTARSALR